MSSTLTCPFLCKSHLFKPYFILMKRKPELGGGLNCSNMIWNSPLICRCLVCLSPRLPFHRFRVSSTFSLSPSPCPSCPVVAFLDAASYFSIFQHLPNVIERAGGYKASRFMYYNFLR